jgi:hypothetical protein
LVFLFLFSPEILSLWSYHRTSLLHDQPILVFI